MLRRLDHPHLSMVTAVTRLHTLNRASRGPRVSRKAKGKATAGTLSSSNTAEDSLNISNSLLRK